MGRLLGVTRCLGDCSWYVCPRCCLAGHARSGSKVSSPDYLINQAFQGKNAFKPAAPLNELSVDELKGEYQALRDIEKALTKRLALETRDNPSASREQVIDAAVNAFTAGAFTEEEMQAMIREANARSR